MAHLSQALTYFLAMLFSLTFHECAHALVAKLRGDSTAEGEGRLSLNPLVHMDPVGTVVLPIVGALAALPVIGWAKPVPVDLSNLENPRRDHCLIAAAGPGSNLLLCFICVLAVGFYEAHLTQAIPEGSFFFPLTKLLMAMVWVNAFLAFFNLIPLPPLDGAAVFGTLLPEHWAEAYERYVHPYGFMILLFLLMAGGLRWLPPVAEGYVRLMREAAAPISGLG